jgi:hypothetical protein
MSIGVGERITTHAITCTEVAFEVLAPELVPCCHLGESLRIRFGLPLLTLAPVVLTSPLASALPETGTCSVWQESLSGVAWEQL